MKTRIFVLATLAAALTACSSVPDRNSSLDQARSNYAAAQANPQIKALAADELQSAAEALRIAEQANTDGSPVGTIDHLAYMAAQRVVIAEETASSRAAQAITAGAAAERDKMRLAMRTDEADTAQRQLAVRTAEANTAQRRLAESQQNEQRNDARVSDLESQLAALNAKKTERGMVVTLGDVLFKTGQAQLLPGSADNLAKLAEFFKRNPERKASIEGHTDSVGSANANHTLSERRATAVMLALVKLGVGAERLSTQAFGEDSPTASNDNATGRQLNRRVEIVFPTQPADLSAK